jgi:type IV pilus assembly protein PilC
VPTSRRKQSTLFGRRPARSHAADIAIFSRQMATMMTAGIPLVQSFDIIGAGHENPAMQKLILTSSPTSRAASTLHEALEEASAAFRRPVREPGRGRRAGRRARDAARQDRDLQGKTEAIKKKIKKALFYPASVVVVAIIVTAILLIFVIPQFESLFQGFGADLPAFTQMVIDISKFVQDRGWLIGAWRVVGFASSTSKKRSRRAALHRPRDR